MNLKQNARLLLLPLFLGIFIPFQLSAQDDLSIVKTELSRWEMIADKVTDVTGIEKSIVEGTTYYVATAKAFGSAVKIDLSKSEAEHVKLGINFPKEASLGTEQAKSLFGETLPQLLPVELNGQLKLERLEVEFLQQNILSAKLRMTAASWVPLADQETFRLSNLNCEFYLIDPLQKVVNVGANIDAQLYLPDLISEYLNLKNTTLSVFGSANSKSKELALVTDLTSDKVYLGDQNVVGLENAYLGLFIKGKTPNIVIGGGIVLTPPNEQPIKLKGEAALNLTSGVFCQGWMDESTWQNPFNISKDLYITNLGLGFGVSFKKAPYPLPILAFEGGVSVGNPDPTKAKFSAKATVGINSGDPDQCVLDINHLNANLNDIISTFFKGGVPNHLTKTLNEFQINNARLTVVPMSSDGVSLFGQTYEPGVHMQGKFKAQQFNGIMYLDIRENELKLYSKIGAIRGDGYSITSVDGTSGPELLCHINADALNEATFILDSKIETMGMSKLSKIHFSDAGFEVRFNDKLLDIYESEVHLAGANIFKGKDIYLKANFKTDMFNKINEIAADEIGKTAESISSEINHTKSLLEAERPLLEQSKKDYEAIKASVQAENEKNCAILSDLKAQEAAQKKEQDRLTKIIEQLDLEISSLKSQIEDGFRPATFIKKTTCSDISQYDPRNGGECWSCPSGSKRDIIQPVNSTKACFYPEHKVYSKATYQGKSTGPLFIKTDCPPGQIYDPIDGGTCWSYPAGYQRENLETIKSDKAYSKIIPNEYTSSNFLGSLACNGENEFVDLRNGGECWSCPTGFTRPITTVPVTGQKACEKTNMAQLKADLLLKEADRVATIGDRDIIQGTLGNLKNQMTEALKKSCEAVANSELVNADPRVAPKFGEMTTLMGKVEGLQEVLTGLNSMSNGTLKAVEWMVRTGGNASGIVNITEASFTGCLSLAKDGKVALEVKGTYAGDPIDVSFDINLKSPESHIRAFADMLMQTNSASSTYKNGNCSKPQVPKPIIKDEALTAFINGMKNSKEIGTESSHKPESPTWASVRRFKDGNYNEQLKIALALRDADKMLDLSTYKIKLNIKDQNNASPLMWVTHKKGFKECLRMIEAGADPKIAGAIYANAQNTLSYGNLLCLAVSKKDKSFVYYLTSVVGIPADMAAYNPATQQMNGWRALEWAAYLGQDQIIQVLIDEGAKPINSPSAALLAAKAKHNDIAKDLVLKGFPLDTKDANGYRIIHYACQNADLSLVKTIISKGADINAQTNEGWSPLIIAAYNGKTEIAKTLLAAGANKELKYEGKNASKWARKNGFSELSKFIKKGE